MKTIETTADSKEMFSGKILHLFHDEVILPDGERAMREIVRHPGGVCIAALDSDNSLFFVRQFRYPYKEEVLELPAGQLAKGLRSKTASESCSRKRAQRAIRTYLWVRSTRPRDTPTRSFTSTPAVC